MHPVIANILKQKDKKEEEKNEDNKIALVLYGGIMSGVVGTGATSALEELKLTHAFDYVFTFSAGFANASYFLSHQASLSSSVYIDNLSGTQFINTKRFWNIVDIEHLMHILKNIKPLDVSKIFECNTKIILRIKNKSLGRVEFLTVDKSFKDTYFNPARNPRL